MLVNFEEFEIFLVGTFHQDMVDPMEAFREYLQEVDKRTLDAVANGIISFLACDLSEFEKEQFIERSTFIYFPALGVKPIKWLESVLDDMKKVLSKSEN